MQKSFVILFFIVCVNYFLRGQDQHILQNEKVSFTLREQNGRLQLREIKLKNTVFNSTEVPLFGWEDDDTILTEVGTIEQAPATRYEPAHQRLEAISQRGAAKLKRVFKLYPDATGLRCEHYYSGTWRADKTQEASQRASGIEEAVATDGKTTSFFKVKLPDRHWSVKTVSFTDVTDLNNNFVDERRDLLFDHVNQQAGNVLIARSTLGDQQLWVLKEAPLGAAQVAYPGYDFSFNYGGVAVVGKGISFTELDPEAWTRGYSWAVGLTDKRRFAANKSILTYQQSKYRYLPERDGMVLMNTWGDRGRDSRVNEAFVLAELDIAARLGVTHFQIDDGWQAALSKNSITDGAGNRWEEWGAADWEPHPERFPDGLGKIVAKGKRLNIDIGLWFNATRTNDYENWERDANTLIALYEKYGIRTFKVDGLQIESHRGEANVRRLFEKVRRATGGRVIFNVDTTAGRRGGYFSLTEYSNLFIENRYTDWGRYYPHWTLRNLWQLAHYVPTNKMQIEALNQKRNPGEYPEGDVLAPNNYDFEYCLAVTGVAQPLIWLEGSNLDAEQRETTVLHEIKTAYPELHQGITLPIGQQPDGASWTGFQTIVDDTTGYLFVFREVNDTGRYTFKTTLEDGVDYVFEKVSGVGSVTKQPAGRHGETIVNLPRPRSFALWRYTAVRQ